MAKQTTKADGQVFRGTVGEMKPDAVWLSNLDLSTSEDNVFTVTEVRRFDNVRFKDGRSTDGPAFALCFAETSKMLMLNVTNRRRMAMAAGSNNIDEWAGARIGLFVDRGKFFGKEQNCVRIRQKPFGRADLTEKQEVFDLAEEAIAAIQACDTVEKVHALRPKLSASGFEGGDRKDVADAFNDHIAALTERVEDDQ